MKIEQQNTEYFSEYINNTLGEAAHVAAEINREETNMHTTQGGRVMDTESTKNHLYEVPDSSGLPEYFWEDPNNITGNTASHSRHCPCRTGKPVEWYWKRFYDSYGNFQEKYVPMD
jgi:hypothetical protein